MTYNIGHYDYGVGVGLPSNIYNEKLANYRNFFDETNVDILGLQEWAQYLDQNNTANSDSVLFNDFFRYNGGETNIWCALKGKVLMYDLQSGSLGNRPYVAAKALNRAGVVQLYSVHFSPGSGNASLRVSEANELLTKLNGVSRFIIFGDFNPDPGEEDTLFALFSNHGCNIANCGSFGKFPTLHNHPNYYVDNIITSSNIRITNVKLMQVYDKLSSDHVPLMAELEIT